jgi:hypothetical protein
MLCLVGGAVPCSCFHLCLIVHSSVRSCSCSYPIMEHMSAWSMKWTGISRRASRSAAEDSVVILPHCTRTTRMRRLNFIGLEKYSLPSFVFFLLSLHIPSAWSLVHLYASVPFFESHRRSSVSVSVVHQHYRCSRTKGPFWPGSQPPQGFLWLGSQGIFECPCRRFPYSLCSCMRKTVHLLMSRNKS